eukprot:scaffold273235_cov32-Prasinocladus_malaysianus.AAC.1
MKLKIYTVIFEHNNKMYRAKHGLDSKGGSKQVRERVGVFKYFYLLLTCEPIVFGRVKMDKKPRPVLIGQPTSTPFKQGPQCRSAERDIGYTATQWSAGTTHVLTGFRRVFARTTRLGGR